MKALLLMLCLGLFTVTASAQEDVDPEVMNAILDAQQSSSKDPMKEAVEVNPPKAAPEKTAAEKAREAAEKLKDGIPAEAAPKPREVKPTIVKEFRKKGPEVITEEEAKMLQKLENDRAEKEENVSSLATDPSKKRKPIYVPAPVQGPNSEAGFMIERDSGKIVTRTMSVNDALNVKICYNAGVTIALDHDIQDEFQRVILDESQFFSAQQFENNRGVFVALKKEIPPGKYWESAIRLVRKSDDKTYLVNLIGVSCPGGLVPYPKVIYLREHFGHIGSNNKVLTPEDTIIQMSKGMPRIQKNRIRVYDMVASSASNWLVFGIEVQYPENSKMTVPKMVILDSLQVNKLGSKLEYLPLPSKKATEIRGVPTLRFKLSVNVGKNYILRKRYLHLMYLDEEVGHYQYVRVDTLPYFLSLVRRGFEL